jgi:starch phosphorylase
VDLWLNTPRRPREASGTSGMKVTMNLGINASILDGWWPEVYDSTNGWAIGNDRDYETEEEQDEVDTESLYQLLEQEILNEFHSRDAAGLPLKWIQRMRRSLETCCRQFNTHRMVAEYARRYYDV